MNISTAGSYAPLRSFSKLDSPLGLPVDRSVGSVELDQGPRDLEQKSKLARQLEHADERRELWRPPVSGVLDGELLAKRSPLGPKEAVDQTMKEYAGTIQDVAKKTGVPRAVITAMLARERMNDEGQWGGRALNRVADALEVSTSLGPAGVSYDAMNVLFEKKPELFSSNRDEMNACYQSMGQLDEASIRWGTEYLKHIHDDRLKDDKLTGDLRWDKAIGLYNEGLNHIDDYSFGSYSKDIQRAMNYAREEWKKRDER